VRDVSEDGRSTCLDKEIEAFVDALVERFKPEKVILFGSHARGGADPGSDVDIFVLMDFDGRPFEQAFNIRSQIEADFPLDILVRRPVDAWRRVNMGDFFLKDILEKGKILYERAG